MVFDLCECRYVPSDTGLERIVCSKSCMWRSWLAHASKYVDEVKILSWTSYHSRRICTRRVFSWNTIVGIEQIILLFIILILRTGVHLLKSYNKKWARKSEEFWQKSERGRLTTDENYKLYDLEENLKHWRKREEFLWRVVCDVQKFEKGFGNFKFKSWMLLILSEMYSWLAPVPHGQVNQTSDNYLS